jgi:hypothetical protein
LANPVSFLIYAGTGEWMDSKREIKVGDEVLCIKESDMPNYIGHIWKVTQINSTSSLYFCVNYELYSEEFIFKKDEIIIPSSLIRELL